MHLATIESLWWWMRDISFRGSRLLFAGVNSAVSPFDYNCVGTVKGVKM